MNFDYLKQFPDMEKLYEYCKEAEDFALSKPNISVSYARKSLEFIVKMIYFSVANQNEDEQTPSVFEMIESPEFQNYVQDSIVIDTIHYIRKMGNLAVHEDSLNKNESLSVLEQLQFLVGEFCILLGLVQDYPEFVTPTDVALNVTSTQKVVSNEDINQLKQIEKQEVVVEENLLSKFADRMRNVKFDNSKNRDEEQNKKLFLSACFREAGFQMVVCKNQSMPECVGINMMLDDGDTVDYVMYGKDNKPLAIVEYSEVVKNGIVAGRLKAIEKANKLAVKYGYKPIVYYTNGYNIYVIDQLGFPPRRVFQFHSIEELELLKIRASIRTSIENPVIDENITNRYYQKEAISSVCNAFSSCRRRSLIVMATGTGKTRVSISLVNILLKANWVKNVLFLADRTSLVRQAHKNFTKLLPSVTTSVYAGASLNKDPNARIIFSTYQTMINLIDDDTKEFSIGRFDLIIIDEAHRSIFKKFGAIFNYFDSLMVGLTATPRSEDNKSTYEIFGLKNGNPDYAYELDKAIDDGFLVGFKTNDRTTQDLKRGICYNDLSDEEKQKFEDTFETDDVDISNTVIDAKTIRSSKYINLGTIDAMLDDLMRNGLKVECDSKIGKTIIFASTHIEAEKIVERFNHIYKYLGSNFCEVIDCQVEDSQQRIDNFCEKDKMPQIAVSVDMMDTGIDVPEILNLVFFKQVKSKIKFMQMIGRGTRLCPNVYGPTLDKNGFLIFDYYDNFRYFNIFDTKNLRVTKPMNITPQNVLINKNKFEILENLTTYKNPNTFENNYKEDLKQYFISEVNSLSNDRIEVQLQMAYVNKYRVAEEWESFDAFKDDEIKNIIIPLFDNVERGSVKMKNFDLMMYVIENQVPKREAMGKDIRKIRHGFGNVAKKIDAMLVELLKLKTIPEIVKEEKLINEMRNCDLIFDNFSLELCEKVRNKLRGLMAYIPDDVAYYILDVKDIVIDSEDSKTVEREKTFLEKVSEYLATNQPYFAKIRNLDEFTAEEKQDIERIFSTNFGSLTEYTSWLDGKNLLQRLRLILGIDKNAITTKFGDFFNHNVLNNEQYEYMSQIISYAIENGDITFINLNNVSPFCDVVISDLFDAQKIIYIKTLVNGLHKPVIM